MGLVPFRWTHYSVSKLKSGKAQSGYFTPFRGYLSADLDPDFFGGGIAASSQHSLRKNRHEEPGWKAVKMGKEEAIARNAIKRKERS